MNAHTTPQERGADAKTLQRSNTNCLLFHNPFTVRKRQSRNWNWHAMAAVRPNTPVMDGIKASMKPGRSTNGRRFRDNLGFGYRQVPRFCITLALLGMGVSVGNIRIRHRGVNIHPDTITSTLRVGAKVHQYHQVRTRGGQWIVMKSGRTYATRRNGLLP